MLDKLKAMYHTPTPDFMFTLGHNSVEYDYFKKERKKKKKKKSYNLVDLCRWVPVFRLRHPHVPTMRGLFIKKKLGD